MQAVVISLVGLTPDGHEMNISTELLTEASILQKSAGWRNICLFKNVIFIHFFYMNIFLLITLFIAVLFILFLPYSVKCLHITTYFISRSISFMQVRAGILILVHERFVFQELKCICASS